jgi:hypothetical protein
MVIKNGGYITGGKAVSFFPAMENCFCDPPSLQCRLEDQELGVRVPSLAEIIAFFSMSTEVGGYKMAPAKWML